MEREGDDLQPDTNWMLLASVIGCEQVSRLHHFSTTLGQRGVVIGKFVMMKSGIKRNICISLTLIECVCSGSGAGEGALGA